MSMEAAGGVLGGAIGGLGNKQRGPSLGENMATMYDLFNKANAQQAVGGFRDLGPAQYYPNQTYAGLSPQTLAGIQQLIGAGSNSPTLNSANAYNQAATGGQYLYSNPANQHLQGMAGTGYGGYDQTAGTYRNIAGTGGMGGYGQVAPGLQQIANQTGGYGANPSASGLNYFGSGGEMNSNPYLNSMYGAASRSVVDNFRNSIAPSLNSAFSSAGRTGSGAAQGAFGQASQSLGNTLGDLGANLYGNAYESGRARQLSALGTQGNLYNAGIGNQMSALNSLNSAYNQGISNQLAGATGLNSSYNSGFGNTMDALRGISDNYNKERAIQEAAAGRAPALNAANITGAQAAVQGGQLLDANNQALIDAEKARWDANQANPRAYYSDVAGLYNGIPAAHPMDQQPQPYNRLAGLLGGSLVGSRVGGLFGPGSISQIFGDFGNAGSGGGGTFNNSGWTGPIMDAGWS